LATYYTITYNRKAYRLL